MFSLFMALSHLDTASTLIWDSVTREQKRNHSSKPTTEQAVYVGSESAYFSSGALESYYLVACFDTLLSQVG
jgi:hypothetical protein